MPASLRHAFRARAHPARSVPCPHEHCRARAHQSCIVRVNGRVLDKPHASRISLWAQTVACCIECVVEPGIPCHHNGTPLPAVHDRRIQEAMVTLA
ncbi:hypothetical protein ACZ90_43785 [Streptomyces albus subsp. albus]|uniref:zinc finger domain-containing protein n=1 Tax=Streptomyces cellulosae TaxID=1968 RepID=UPI0004CBDD70|nr:hypothetical protein [Streptomyces cellulosae]KUJ65753.1 hypothetical protein ACZ90_43785 [Streptomyces albus subsp. albus]